MIRRPLPPATSSSPSKLVFEGGNDGSWTVEGTPLRRIRQFPDLSTAVEAARCACNAAQAILEIWHDGVYICMVQQKKAGLGRSVPPAELAPRAKRKWRQAEADRFRGNS
jgi:hypothetical protein